MSNSNYFSHPLVRIIRVAQFILAVLIFFYVALMPTSGVSGSIPAWLLHFVGNILLVLSAQIALFKTMSIKHLFYLTGTLSLAAEIGQRLTSTRSTDLIDIVTNLTGLVCGLTLVLLSKYTIKIYTENVSE